MFAKLFSSITESSLWSEPKEVRLLFVTMLARADQNGFVEASIPGLARVANLTLEETQFALEVLQNPDPHSKNPADEGRRITKVPGGFALINYEEYRTRRDETDRREYMRNYMVEYRKSRKRPVNDGKPPLTDVSHGKPPLANTDTDTDTDPPKVPKVVKPGERVGDEPKIPKKLDTDRFKKAFADWQSVIAFESANGKAPNPISLQSTLEKLASYPERKACGFILAWIDKRRIYTDWKADWEHYQPEDKFDPYNDNKVYAPRKKEGPRVTTNGQQQLG